MQLGVAAHANGYQGGVFNVPSDELKLINLVQVELART